MTLFLNGLWIGAVLAFVAVGAVIKHFPKQWDDFTEYLRK